MLERLIQLRASLDVVLTGELRFNGDEWELMIALSVVLHPFMQLQQWYEGDSYVTVSMVPYMVDLMRNWIDRLIDNEVDWMMQVESESVKDRITHLAEDMKCYFESRWGCGQPGTVFCEEIVRGPRRVRVGIPKKILLASALDPRTKALACIPQIDQIKIWEAVSAEAQKEFIIQEEKIGRSSESQDVPAVKKQRPNSTKDDMFKCFQQHAPVASDLTNASAAVAAEINRYKLMPVESFNSDPLNFWKKNRHALPILSQLARKLLCIPSTSAASERTFSTAGNIISDKRSRLSSDMVQTLVFLYGAWGLVEKLWARKNEGNKKSDANNVAEIEE